MPKCKVLISSLLFSSVLLSAGEDSPLTLKIRAQTGATAEAGMRNGFGAGISYAFPMGKGALNAELGYQYYSGKQYRQPIPANGLGLTENNSVDSRKNSCDGLALRLSWSQPLKGEWSWQAGASLARFKHHHEAIGTFKNNSTLLAAWTVSREVSGTTISPFAGARLDFGAVGGVEVNLLYQALKLSTVEPVYGAASVLAKEDNRTVWRPKLEAAYLFRF